MCGIAGYYSPNTPEPFEWRERLTQASRRMRLRGPDDHGTFIDERIGLTHRRLAIIDRQGGRQPMQDRETGAVIVFNGEIYNYRELRAELQSAGRELLTQSDTEVLLRAYLEWGAGCLERLLGMFAFAVYTPADGALFLARDRLGVKPLFWSKQQNTFFFASSVRPLLDLLPQRPAINHAALSHYLATIRVNLGSATLLEGIQLIEPGHWIKLDKNGAQKIDRYWSPTCLPPEAKPQQTPAATTARLRELTQDAVRDRLISDVPLGGFLSGGLDSTIIAALATDLTKHRYHAYSVGYRQTGYNEFPFVKEAAAAYRMNCRQIELLPDDYPALWDFLIRQNGLPLATPNEVPIYMLSKALKQDYTVALSGEGADEVFGGYTIPYFAAHDFDRASRHPNTANEASDFEQSLLRAYGQAYLPDLTSQHLLLNAWLTPAEKKLIMHPDITQALDHDRDVRSFYADLYARHPGVSTLDKVMATHLRVNLEGLLLRVDSSSMAASVEVRVPFTDHRLIDFAFAQKDSEKIDWRRPQAEETGRTLSVLEIAQKDLLESKRMLRRAYADIVPASILQRPKMSFPAPVFEWMNDWMKPMIKTTVADSPLRDTIFNPVIINGWLSGQIDLAPIKIWPIVNLCLWQATL